LQSRISLSLLVRDHLDWRDSADLALAAGNMHTDSGLTDTLSYSLPSTLNQVGTAMHLHIIRAPLPRPPSSEYTTAVERIYGTHTTGKAGSDAAVRQVAPPDRYGRYRPLLREYGTYKTVKARFWPWLSGKETLKHFTLSRFRLEAGVVESAVLWLSSRRSAPRWWWAPPLPSEEGTSSQVLRTLTLKPRP